VKKKPLHPYIKALLGFNPVTNDSVVRKDWEKRTKSVCKPCWELKYCPYGPLVEEFPLPPQIREEAIEYNEFLKEQLAKNAYDNKRKRQFERQVKNFNPNNYPEQHSREEREMSCLVYGHLCPVFFVNIPFTETPEKRRIGRYIPRSMMIRVVRRDDYTCQKCGKHLRDDEIEFDHVIPISKGGSSEEHNIRLICRECNRKKINHIEL
jgi:hypothetical protein